MADKDKANQNNDQANQPDTSQGNNDGEKQGDNGGDNATGNNAASNIVEKPDGITPEIQKYIDSQAAAARRSGEAKGKTDAETQAAEAKKAADAKAKQDAAKAKGEFEELHRQEEAAHTETKTKLSESETDKNRLLAAIEVGLPNVKLNYKRIVGSTYDEMLEDAKALKASFGNEAYREEEKPPITPNVGDGGKFEHQGDKKLKVTDEEIAKARQSGNYNAF